MEFLYKYSLTKFLMPIRLNLIADFFLADAATSAGAADVLGSMGAADAFGGAAAAATDLGTGIVGDALAGNAGSGLASDVLANGLPNVGATGPMAQGITSGGIGAGAGVNAEAVQNAAMQIPNSGIASAANAAPQTMTTDQLLGNNFAQEAPTVNTSAEVGAGSAQPTAEELARAANSTGAQASDLALTQAANNPITPPSIFDQLSNNPIAQGFKTGIQAFQNYAKENPITTAVGAYTLGSKLGLNRPNSTGIAPQQPGIAGSYVLNPATFQGFHPNPQNYTAQQTMFSNLPVRSAAMGGIMQAAPNYPMAHNMNAQYTNPNPQMPVPSDVTGMSGVQSYKKGDLTTADEENLFNTYSSMISGTPSSSSYTPPFRDSSLPLSDSATQGMSPQEAALYRMKTINSRAGMQGPQLNVPTGGIGQINLTPLMLARQKAADQQAIQAAQGGDGSDVQSSAHGGIMQAHGHLGNYAHGGNPRLLKGPGDGMSDNIPATIDGKQPARLATGEFVVPADVVSHMGNGDTDAGAKKLHDWMATVRKARTGNPKQGKEINADKYLPK